MRVPFLFVFPLPLSTFIFLPARALSLSLFFFFQDRHIDFPFYSLFSLHCSRRSSGRKKQKKEKEKKEKEKKKKEFLFFCFFFVSLFRFVLTMPQHSNRVCTARQDLFSLFACSIDILITSRAAITFNRDNV